MANPLSKIRILSSIVLLVAVAALGSTLVSKSTNVSRQNALTQDIQPSVINQTIALQITKVGTVNNADNADIELTLLNQSSKTITAYMISIGDLSITTFPAMLEPGKTKVERIPAGNLSQTTKTKQSLVISAIYFAGGESEGNPQHVTYLNNRMAGIREQTERVLSILRDSLRAPRSNLAETLQGMESQATLLPVEETNNVLSPQQRGGRAWIKERFQRDIQRLKRQRETASGPDNHLELAELVAAYEQLLAQL